MNSSMRGEAWRFCCILRRLWPDCYIALDVDFTNGTLREPSQAIDGNPLNFKVVNMTEHPITEGLDSFSAYGAWALRGTAPHSKIIAETSQYSWVDLSRDNQLSKGEPVQAFGVMVAGVDRAWQVCCGR